MMNILGIHFGHDGTVSVVQDGKIVANILRERQTCSKHAISIDEDCLRLALWTAGLSFVDIDLVALTSTQKVDVIGALTPSLKILPDNRGGVIPRLANNEYENIPGFDSKIPLLTHYVDAFVGEPTVALHPIDKVLTREFQHLPKEDWHAWGVPRVFPGDRLWTQPLGFEGLINACNLSEDRLREYGFHMPLTIELDGRKVPGAFIHHHVCHAASTFYRSPFIKAAIFTQDGDYGTPGLNTGGFFWGDNDKLIPLTPHYSPMGFFYESVGQFLRLSTFGAPGKLMGLAPYGLPRFFHTQFVGNDIDLQERGLPTAGHSWLVFVMQLMIAEGIDLSQLGKASKITKSVNADIAASAQLLLEENRLAAAQCLARIVNRLNIHPEGLCLSGGVALNCPANTRLATEGPLAPVFVEPNCDDGGLAVGAALYLTHHLLGIPRNRSMRTPSLPQGMTGETHPFTSTPTPEAKSIEKALHQWEGKLQWSKVDNSAREAAEEIAKGKLVAWFQGPSEVGPRALGRRSLLADARLSNTWQRVNQAKDREAWRPFAPAVLESVSERWFEGMPLPSPYMLFTGKVKGTNLPGVTHVDGTARVQTVADADIPFADLLREFASLTDVPVVLNTSLNGRNQPIVESPNDALSLYASGMADILFIGPYRVERR